MKFQDEFKKISWWDLYCSTDVNVAVDILTRKFSDILDKFAPVKKFQSRKRYAPWISCDTKKLMKMRNQAQVWATTTQNPEDWSKYKSLRNAITKRLRVEKHKWQKSK